MKHAFKKFLIGALISASGIAFAATFNLFSPATGILKGSATSYITSAATSSDITATFSGTCNSSSFLRGDGACNSVSLTAAVSGTLPFANGGTGLSTAADDTTLVSSGAAWVASVLPNCGSATQALAYSTSTNSFSCQTITGSGTNPGGSNTQVQFNDSSAFGGDADFTWDKTNNILAVGSTTTPGTIRSLDGGAVTGAQLTVRSGAGTSNGGTMFVTSGDGSSSGSAGGILIQPGTPGTGVVGANVTVQAGSGGATSGAGGTLNLNGGNGTTTNGNAGALNITGGAGRGSGSGGGITITAGPAGSSGLTNDLALVGGAGGSSSGAAGNITLTGGTPTDGNGGSITVAGSAGVGTNRSGGSVTIQAGAKTGSGTVGRINLANGFVSTGTKFTASGCSNSTTVGGTQAGTFTSGTTGVCTVTITLPTAPNGWTCYASDLTTPANIQSQSASTATSCTVTGTTASGDVVSFMAIGF